MPLRVALYIEIIEPLNQLQSGGTGDKRVFRIGQRRAENNTQTFSIAFIEIAAFFHEKIGAGA